MAPAAVAEPAAVENRHGLPDLYDPTAFPAPKAPGASPAAPRGEATFDDLGARIAGGALLLNGLLLLFDVASTSGGGKTGLVSVGIDLFLGTTLVMGNDKHQGFALIRAGLGAVVYPVIFYNRGEVALAAIQLAFSGALVALLWGNPKKLRLGIATAVLAAYFLLSLAGLAMGGEA